MADVVSNYTVSNTDSLPNSEVGKIYTVGS